MATRMKLAAQPRTEAGSRECRRLRSEGLLPGNVYGHKEAPVPVKARTADVLAIVKSGAHVVDIEVDGKVSTAVIREVQWDGMGDFVQHFDLLRVDPDERVVTEVHLDLKGTAPGVLAGGILEQPLRSVHLECLAIAIPDSLVVRIGSLEVGQSIHVRELEIPEGTKVLNSPDLVVVHIVKATEQAAAGAEAGPAQPEVITRKPAADAAADGGADKGKKK